jgi:N-acetylglutamate synthase-like GNAT family acetyltransferase
MIVDISSNKEKLNMSDIHEMLSKVFWSPGITENEILKGIHNSALVVGAYSASGRQIGFLRVVSDTVRFAYFLDVVVHADYRRHGIGQKMVKFALSHPELKDVYQWFLMTKNAHGVYGKCGFEPLTNPERWMTITKPRPDRTNFSTMCRVC